MEKKKKSNCSCFGFFRRKVKTPSKEPFRNSSSLKHIQENQNSERVVEENALSDRSLGVTQKLLPGQPQLRSSIMTPSRRTPQLHRLLPSVFGVKHNSIKPDLSASVETSLSRPSTFRELPINSAISIGANAFAKDFKRDDDPKEVTYDFITRIKQNLEENATKNNEKSEKKLLQEGFYLKNPEKNEKKIENQGSEENFEDKNKNLCEKINKKLNILQNSEESEPKKDNPEQMLLKFNQNHNFYNDISPIPEEISPNPQEPFCYPGQSPDLFSNSSRLGLVSDNNMPSLQISPIKCLASIDDYTDILTILSNPEKIKQIPDVFIRNPQNPLKLPVLKPTTPYYFSKRRVLPIFRQNNKIL